MHGCCIEQAEKPVWYVFLLFQIKTVDKEIFTAVRSQSNTQTRSRWA
jgi:hypothetical protein